jgi:hypothetical protein
MEQIKGLGGNNMSELLTLINGEVHRVPQVFDHSGGVLICRNHNYRLIIGIWNNPIVIHESHPKLFAHGRKLSLDQVYLANTDQEEKKASVKILHT